MWQKIKLFFSNLWQAILNLFRGKPQAWSLDPEIIIEPYNFTLRVRYQVAGAGQQQLYIQIQDVRTKGDFFTMEAIDKDTGEISLLVSSLDIPPGDSYNLCVVTGDGNICPESPTVSIDTPYYPELY